VHVGVNITAHGRWRESAVHFIPAHTSVPVVVRALLGA
jgi:hypothetical protein